MTSPLRTITDADAIAAALVRHLRDEREADRTPDPTAWRASIHVGTISDPSE